MADAAFTAPGEKTRKIQGEMEREKGSTTARSYELRDHQLPQELEYAPHGPKEIDSREVHEANGGF